MSRRERTDRLRRASDGAESKGTRCYQRRRSKRTTLSPLPLSPSRRALFRSSPPSLLFYFTTATLLVVDVAAIRQKSGFAVTRPRRNFPGIAHTLPSPSSSSSRLSFSFSFFSRKFRWKNMAFCLRFCILLARRVCIRIKNLMISFYLVYYCQYVKKIHNID